MTPILHLLHPYYTRITPAVSLEPRGFVTPVTPKSDIIIYIPFFYFFYSYF